MDERQDGVDSGRHFVWERRKFKREKREREKETTTNSVCVSCLGERDEAILLFLVAAGISAH